MADVKTAIDFVMHQEDAQMTGKITTLAGDIGGATRYGIASKFHPGLVYAGFFDFSMPNSEAYPLAQRVYAQDYCAPLLLDQIVSQDLANHLLSFAINDGCKRGVLLLQWAINELLIEAVVPDGVMGAKTVYEANRCMPTSLLNALRLQEIAFHVELAADTPQFLLGWLRRDLA